ncbi:MAG: acyl-CoA dehydrogenase family protein [Polyangiaceae bacterium]|nr:acyl-CoA dehydrogenase family protein [Polyangiaceae bacterium]
MRGKSDIFTPVIRDADSVSPRLTNCWRSSDERDAVTAILREVDRYCSKEIDGAAIDKRHALGQETLTAIGERGWFGLTVPEEFDGAGLSMTAAAHVASEICSYNGSLGTCVGLHSGLALYGLLHLASRELQERYLPEIAAGERIAAFCATEPNAGSDIAAMRTVLSERDGVLRLNGSKCYVTNGGFAGILTVVAASPGMGGAKGGHTMIVVDPSWAGVVKQPEENKLGLKGSSTISIDFEDVEIPQSHVVGEFSKGLELAHESLTWGRSFMAAGCLGAAKAAVVETREHIAVRKQFGRTLDQFPLVREQMAGCVADVYAIESMLRLVCDIFDSKSGEIALESTALKVLASERTWSVCDRGIQLMGGAGYMEDTGMPRRLRDVRVTRIFEGANDVLKLHLAMATLGWNRAGLLDIPKLESRVPDCLRVSAGRFDELLARLGQELAVVQRKHGFKLFQKQCLQSVMAEVIIPLYGMLAVLLRAMGVVVGDSSAAESAEVATALLSLRRLELEAIAALSVLCGEDEGAAGLVDRVLGS